MTKKKLTNIIIILLSFGFILYIMHAVPFTRDDWAWGGSVGAERLATHFANYNGRYLGNLLILLLTKSQLAKTLGMAVVAFSVPYLIYKYVCKDQIFYFLLSLALLFAMPSNVYRQTMGWASGLANYIPPIAFTLLYLALIQDVFKEKPPVYKKWYPAVTFIIGAAGNLFMEHVTLLNLVLGAGIIVYAFIRFKKVFASHIAYLAGAAVGTAIMFSNSAYGIIASGNDFYRSVPKEGGLLAHILENIKIIYTRSVESNAVLNLVLSVLLLLIIKNYIDSRNTDKKEKSFLITAITVNFVYVIWCFIRNFAGISVRSINTPVIHIIRAVFGLIFILNLIIIPVICISDKHRAVKITAPVLAAIVLCVPLLVVSPVTGRCFYPVYILFIVYSCEIMFYILENCGNIVIVKDKRIINAALLASLCIVTVFYGNKFTKIAAFENERTSYVQEQVKAGNETVYIPDYPKSLKRFTEGTKPEKELWQTRYKDFFGIDQNINLTPIPYSEYEKQRG